MACTRPTWHVMPKSVLNGMPKSVLNGMLNANMYVECHAHKMLLLNFMPKACKTCFLRPVRHVMPYRPVRHVMPQACESCPA